MDLEACYFYTATINGFRHLLADDKLKMVVIDSLRYLYDSQLAKIYGFVIMPNHIHLLWSLLAKNGEESVAGSFAKYTGHLFKKHLAGDVALLESYLSSHKDRQFHFWKRDPLAISISSEKILLSKLEYMHDNPIKEKWRLATYPEEYRWSSANFYLTGEDEFGLLTHFSD